MHDLNPSDDAGTRERSDRERAIAELRQTEYSCRDLIENAVVGIFQTTPEGCFIAANPAFARLLGYASPEKLMANAPDLSRGIHVDPRRHADLARRLEAHGTATNFETEVFRRDRTRLWVSLNARAVRGRGGELLCHEVFAQDITGQKELEAQVLRAQRLDSIGTLASGVAHDLNNILTPILICAPMLHEDMPREQRTELVSMIEAGAERGAEILKQMLAFCRGAERERHSFQVGSLVKEIVGLVAETFPRDIRIQNFVPHDLWPITVDATQMHQVLLNLCVNARDAMPAGGTLSLRAGNVDLDESLTAALPAAKCGRHVLLEVSDTGTGIEPEIIERIFDPFFTTKPTGKGTGLGLSTVLGIVKGHGGFLQIESEPPLGTTFKMYLPAGIDDAATMDDVKLENDLPAGNGELIMIVDDERAVRAVAKAVLDAHGYQTLLAADGAEALTLFSQHATTIAAVLTDVLMPVMDGIELIRALRRLDGAVRVIASSGETDHSLLAAAEELNVTGVLQKPYRTAALLRAIHAAIHLPCVAGFLAAAI